MKQVSIETQEKFIAQVYELDKERQILVSELQTMPDSEIAGKHATEILERLDSIYHAQASNAVILADFLKANIG